MTVAVAMVEACCSNCTAGKSVRCWHAFGLLYVLENLKRGEASLAPESTTAGENSWERDDVDENWCDKLKPASSSDHQEQASEHWRPEEAKTVLTGGDWREGGKWRRLLACRRHTTRQERVSGHRPKKGRARSCHTG